MRAYQPKKPTQNENRCALCSIRTWHMGALVKLHVTLPTSPILVKCQNDVADIADVENATSCFTGAALLLVFFFCFDMNLCSHKLMNKI